MGAVGRRNKPNRPHPGPDDPGILPGRQMRRLCNAARKEELLWLQMGRRDPRVHRVPRLLGDLELDRALGLLLHDYRPRRDRSALDDIVDAKPNQIAPAQLAVDTEIEQREFPDSMVQLQSNPDGPDLLQLQCWFLAEQLAFVPRQCRTCGLGSGIHEWLLC